MKSSETASAALRCLCLALILAFALSCSSESSTPPFQDPGLLLDGGLDQNAKSDQETTTAPVPEPFHESFAVWVIPEGPRSFTTSESEVTLRGAVEGTIETLEARVTASDGTTETVALEPKSRFTTPELSLSEGDNEIVLFARFKGGKESTDKIVVSYYYSVSLGAVSVTPNEMFADSTTPSLVEVKIAADDEIATVDLVAAGEGEDPAQGPSLLALNDQGLAGDKVANDSVYTGTRVFAADGVGEKKYRLRIVGVEESFRALSEVVSVAVLKPLSDEDIDRWLASADSAAEEYQKLHEGRTQDEALKAFQEKLKSDPHITGVELYPSGQGLAWTMDSGLEASMSDAPADSRGQGAMIESKAAILYNPFDVEFAQTSSARIADKALARSKCPPLGPVTKKYNLEADVEAFKSVHLGGLLTVDAHGAYARFGAVIIILNQVVKRGAMDDLSQSYRLDAAQKRLVAGALSAHPGKSFYSIAPNFVRHYNRPIPQNTIWFVASCHSLGNATMVQAFLENGGGTFLGFTHSVGNGYAAMTADEIFNRLVEGKNTLEVWDSARKKYGKIDPSNPACRLAMVPAASTSVAAAPCNGYTHMVDTAINSDPSDSNAYAGSTEYHSVDEVVVSPFDVTGNTLIMKSALKECSFHYTKGDPLKPEEVWAGHGISQEEYQDTPRDLSNFNVDPERRLGVLKLRIDRADNSVTIAPIPETSYYDEDPWVDQVKQSSGKISRRQGFCAFEGGSDALPEDASIFHELVLRPPKVSITSTAIEGNFDIQNEKGIFHMEFKYPIPE